MVGSEIKRIKKNVNLKPFKKNLKRENPTSLLFGSGWVRIKKADPSPLPYN